MSEASVPLLEQYLDSLSHLLARAEAHTVNRKIELAALLAARLYPDMFPFTRQVQLACDFAKGAIARLSGAEAPTHNDAETSFGELRERIDKTLAFIRSVDPKNIDGSEKRTITLRFGGRDLLLRGDCYLFGFAIPSMLFHVTTAYVILRHNGVEIGKADFLGQLPGI